MPGLALPGATARLFWFDTVNAHPSALRCACETYGSDRLLLGTDTPYWQDGLYQLAVDYIAQSGLSAQDVERIRAENAFSLFGARLSQVVDRMKKSVASTSTRPSSSASALNPHNTDCAKDSFTARRSASLDVIAR